jgi:hypothetical protein
VVVVSGACSGSGSTGSDTSASRATKSSGLVLRGLAQATRLLVTGAHGTAAGAGSTAILVAETVAVLARSGSSSSSSNATSGESLGGTANTVSLTSSVGLVLAIVVALAVEVHALVTFELLILKLSAVRLGASLKLSELLGSSLSKTTTLRSKLL